MTSLLLRCFSKSGHFAFLLRWSWDLGFSVKIGTVPPKSGRLDTLRLFLRRIRRNCRYFIYSCSLDGKLEDRWLKLLFCSHDNIKICDMQEFPWNKQHLITLSQAYSHLIGPLTLFHSNCGRLGDALAWGLQNGGIEVIDWGLKTKSISFHVLSILFSEKIYMTLMTLIIFSAGHLLKIAGRCATLQNFGENLANRTPHTCAFNDELHFLYKVM